MDPNIFPTKGNLIKAKNSLKLSHLGHELMDKKRNILVHELMDLIDSAKSIQKEIFKTYTFAYDSLQKANISLGITNIMDFAASIPIDNDVVVKSRSIMGVEIPLVEYSMKEVTPSYSFYGSNEALDAARTAFEKVKVLSVRLSEIENSAYRLAYNARKAQKRTNALENITIPYYTELVKSISESLEEKEREEFARHKVIKKRQQTN